MHRAPRFGKGRNLPHNRNGGSPPYGSDPSGSDGDNSLPPSSQDDEISLNNNDDYPKPPKPAVFGRTRYSSVDRTFNERETFSYDPTPRTEEEVMRACFRSIEELIIKQLHGPPIGGNTNVQKTILQSIPKPDKYTGEGNDFVAFDTWVRDLVRWFNIADLCGPEVRYSYSRKQYVLTPVDIQRTNATGSFLKGPAHQWFLDDVEHIPMDYLIPPESCVEIDAKVASGYFSSRKDRKELMPDKLRKTVG
ncbi:hypothetical protein D9758_016930 [Tetrapyrgos nigripes]|uniref:Uncharacterized protein n=1 Tax=Tetrapyrgos nigripes TaxID=182062 RepID=A0A8H5FNP3_9AGAR|nr:hypothetical protein D9758_016930 [Tetrapyrgos nigripes]